ncbi:MAG: hypothetical protein CVT66_09590 [Actinobacteria bacterium HGW-Actinobacteria-6]|nr:MAG: hypothetical protein CVT66_09590 [Actinobacteria bacterium HGW-Actinobacteria-6]
MKHSPRHSAARRFSNAMIALQILGRGSGTGGPTAECVTPAQGMLVHAVALQGTKGATTKALAQQLAVSSSAVTQLVDGLVSERILHRTPDSDDRRKVRITLTEHGTELYRQFDRARLAQASAMLAPLDDDEASELARLLAKISHTELSD